MADRFSGQIEIGGNLKRADIDKLVQQLINRTGPDWGDYYNEESAREAIFSASNTGNLLFSCSVDASYGRFSELESACQDLGLTYLVSSEPAAGYDGEIVWFTPEEGEREMVANHDGEPLVLITDLKQMREDNETDAEFVEQVKLLIAENETPVVPPLVIVDDAA